MNTFGYPSLKFQLCDPKSVDRPRFQRDHAEIILSLSCPVGRSAAQGWILLPRYEYTQLDPYYPYYELVLDGLPFYNLSIVQARCVTRGLASDVNALYLVELTDTRGVLKNKWFQYPINAQYNMRAPAYPQLYYSNSLNAGVAWTWNTLIGSLWASMPMLGAYPGIPVVPLGTPENWYFAGTSAWDALCDVLYHVGMTVECDLTAAAPYSIVVSGADDLAFDALSTLSVPNLTDDLEWLDTGNGRVPRIVHVYFRIRAEQYGQEETVIRDGSQWTSTPLYTVAVNTPFTTATGYHSIRDDFTVRVDYDGVPLVTDTAAAALIAAERVTQYLAKIKVLETMTRVYAGALPFWAGSLVDSVCWEHGTLGWQTRISRGYGTR